MANWTATLTILCICATAVSSELDAVWPEFEERLNDADKEKLQRLRGSKQLGFYPENRPPLAASGQPVTVFARPYWETIDFNSVPDTAEIQAPLSVSAARGEREFFTIGVYPHETVAEATVVMDELVSASGAKLPASLWQFSETKYLPVCPRYTYKRKEKAPASIIVAPAYIVPTSKVTIRKGVTRQVWGAIRIPSDAAAGVYTGKLRIKSAGADIATMEMRLRVYPFKLEISDDHDFGWFYGPGPNMPAELAQLSDRGINSVSFPIPKFKVADGKPVVDFTEWEKIAAVCKERRMNGRHIFYALMVARRIQAKEFSTEHMRLYREIMRQIFEWSEKQGIKMMAWTVDEPRERDINPWNRNYADTIKYLDAFKGIKGALTMASPMRDLQHGKDYVPMMEHMDVLYTHPWEQSKRFIAAAKEQNKPFISYNSVRDRMSFGFGTWNIGAVGRWQWHYKTGTSKEQAFDLDTFTIDKAGAARVAFTTSEGPLSTPVLEWTSEGIDDYWYIRTLEAALKSNRGNPARKSAVESGEHLLVSLKAKLADIDGGALKHEADDSGEAKTPFNRFRMAEDLRKSLAAAIAALNGAAID